VLYDQYFTVEDKEDLNLQAMIKSDFIRANVNFFFVHVDSGHNYLPNFIFEGGKKLAVSSIPGGTYRLVIFSQNCADDKGLRFKAMHFQFRFIFNSFEESQTTQIRQVTQLQTDKQKRRLGKPIELS
jgi:hypothetical protein